MKLFFKMLVISQREWTPLFLLACVVTFSVVKLVEQDTSHSWWDYSKTKYFPFELQLEDPGSTSSGAALRLIHLSTWQFFFHGGEKGGEFVSTSHLLVCNPLPYRGISESHQAPGLEKWTPCPLKLFDNSSYFFSFQKNSHYPLSPHFGYRSNHKSSR